MVVGILTGSLVVAIISAGAAYLIGAFASSVVSRRELMSGEQISGEKEIEGVKHAFRGVVYKEDSLPNMVYLPFFSLHLGAIFAGDILLFDVNFFESKEPNEYVDDQGNTIYYIDKDGDGKYNDNIDVITSTSSASSQLRGIVSSWYYRLRAIALIASMLILIYIGIRITFSSLNPSGKAKYKNMLMDWIVSICLIFCMHYVMLFSIKIVEYVTDFIHSTSNEGGTYMVMIEPNGVMKDNLKDVGFDYNDDTYFVDGDSIGINGKVFSFPTNMFGYIRMMSQFTVGFTYVGYAIIYIICVLFILFFSFTYLRRVVYMAFLTIIAPLVALTYPIDKINDGSAQAFNMWLKEYIFNLLIQPMHMILYYILISSAFQLASENFLYAIVAICFMVPAEKIVRNFFGFNKAQTPGLLAGAGGAALAMSGLRGLNRFARGGKGPGEHSGGKNGKEEDKTPRFKQTNTFDELAEEGEGKKNEEKSESKPKEQQGGANPDETPTGDGQQDSEEEINGKPVIDVDYEEIGGEQQGGANPEVKQQTGTNQDETQQNSEQQSTTNGKESGETKDQGKSRSKMQDIIDYGDSAYTGVEAKEKTVSRKRAVARVVGRRTLAGGKKLLKSTAKTGAKVAGATVVGLAGGIIGAATGDAKNAMSYATTGGAIGSAIGARVANDFEGIGDRVRNFKQEVANESNDDKEKNELARKQFMKNKEIRKIYEQELGIKGKDKKAQINKAMEQALEYKKYGVKDDKIIAQAMKEEGLGIDTTDKKRIMAAKIAEKVNGSQKTLDDQMKALKERKNYSDDQINRLRQAVANIDGNVT